MISAVTYVTFFLLYDIYITRNISIKATKILMYLTYIEFGYNSPAITTEIRVFSQSEIFQFITFSYLLYLIFKFKIRSTKKYNFSFFLYLLVIIFSDLMLFLFQYNIELPKPGDQLDLLATNSIIFTDNKFSDDHILRIIRVVMLYPFMYVISAKLYCKKTILSISIKFIKYFLLLLLLELIIKLLGFELFYETIYSVLTNQEINSNLLQNRGGFPLLHGFTQEPSHLAYALLLPILLIDYNKQSNINKVFPLIIILSGSFRSISVIFFYIIKNLANNYKINIGILIGLTVVSLFNLDYANMVIERFYGLFNLINDESSTVIRLISWEYSLNAIINYPFVGVGLGTISSSSGLLGSIASIGFIGILCYFILIISVYGKLKIDLNLIFLLIFMLFSFNVHILYNFSIINIFIYSIYNDKIINHRTVTD